MAILILAAAASGVNVFGVNLNAWRLFDDLKHESVLSHDGPAEFFSRGQHPCFAFQRWLNTDVQQYASANH